MSEKLVIVESPSKSRTIEQYLGKDYVVRSSKGHIRDLAISGPGGLGIDVKRDFKPEYVVLPEKRDVVRELNKALKTAKEVYLATDPDREGEAISWHLSDALEIGNKPVRRVVFHEITKPAILEAFQNTKSIDMDLVSSQETRRILDRIIGFKLSKLLQSKIKSKSAGRVQSAALKLIVDREKEIDRFVVEEYYDVFAQFPDFEAKLARYHDKPVKNPPLAKAQAILAALAPEFTVHSCETKRRFVSSKPPFITSTLQQEASQRLNYAAQKTMQIAQRLYEGVQIGTESIGLITYMRTDSVRMSQLFVNQAETYILDNFGRNYLGHPKKDDTKNRIQDAHEAIRPTDVNLLPDKIKAHLSKDELQLYRLIHSRAVASLMKPALYDQTTIDLDNNGARFRSTGSSLVFDGYLSVYGKYESEDTEAKILPHCLAGKTLVATKIEAKQMFTVPPARYTEAKLIKEMEDLGIGRPSTYAQTIQTLKARKYVNVAEKKFVPTEQGRKTIANLENHFHEFISADYSKKMEEILDAIAIGEDQQLKVISDFYAYFSPLVDVAFKELKKEKPRETGETCPVCGFPIVIRQGRYGEFEACGNFPACRYVKSDPKREQTKPLDTKVKCPKCNKGTLIVRVASRGKNNGHRFLGCSTYPKCRYIAPFEAIDEVCPLCGKPLVKEKDGHIRCVDNEKCGFIVED